MLCGTGGGSRLQSPGYLLQWQVLSDFQEMVSRLLEPSHRHTDNVLQDLKIQANSWSSAWDGSFISSQPKVPSSDGLQSCGQRLGHWSSPHLEKCQESLLCPRMSEVGPWPFSATSGIGPRWGRKGTLGPLLYFHEAFGKRGQRPGPSPRNES